MRTLMTHRTQHSDHRHLRRNYGPVRNTNVINATHQGHHRNSLNPIPHHTHLGDQTGTNRGHLILHNDQTAQPIPVMNMTLQNQDQQRRYMPTIRSLPGNNMPMNRNEVGNGIPIHNRRNRSQPHTIGSRWESDQDQVMAESETLNDFQGPCSAGELKARYGQLAEGRTGYAYRRRRWMY